MPFFFKKLSKKIGAALTIGFVGEENGYGLGLPGFHHIIREDLGLLVDAGTAPVNVITIAAELGSGGGGADFHHLSVIGGLPGCHHAAGSHGPDDGHNFVDVYEFLHRIHRSCRGIFFIFHNEFHRAAVDAARFINLGHRHLHASARGDAVFSADGQPEHGADFDGFRRSPGEAGG